MTNKPNLFLFTRAYPFGTGEGFLEAELAVLSNRFARIWIQPLQGAETVRAVPANVRVENPLWTNPSEKAVLYASGLLRPRTLGLIVRELLKQSAPGEGFSPTKVVKVTMWALYKSALERSPVFPKAVAADHPKIAYSYWGHIPSLGLERLAAAGVPTAIRYHRVDLYKDAATRAKMKYLRSKYMPWFREASRYASRLIFISDHGRRYFLDNWPPAQEDRAKLVVSRLGVTDGGVCPARNCSDENFVMASCSRVTPVKRVHLIASLAMELSRYIKVQWHHFGDGDLSLVNQVLASVNPSKLDFKFHGFVPNASVREFYRGNRIDLFVNLSGSEGVPVSIMEAVSANIPVLATATNGSPEIVLDGRSGILCGIEEAVATSVLAERVLRKFRNGSFETLRPRSVWDEHFNATKNYDQLADILTEAAEVS